MKRVREAAPLTHQILIGLRGPPDSVHSLYYYWNKGSNVSGFSGKITAHETRLGSFANSELNRLNSGCGCGSDLGPQ